MKKLSFLLFLFFAASLLTAQQHFSKKSVVWNTEKLDGSINQPGFHSFYPSVSGDEQSLVYIKNFSKNFPLSDHNVMISEKSGNTWPDGTQIFTSSSGLSGWYRSPWLSEDGLRLYYVKQAPASSWRDTSGIYYVARDSVGAPFDLNNSHFFFSTGASWGDINIWLSHDELTMFTVYGSFNQTYLRRRDRDSLHQPFGNYSRVTLQGLDNDDDYIYCPSFTKDLRQLYIYHNPGDPAEETSILVYHQNPFNQNFYEVVDSLKAPGSRYIAPGQLSKDGLSYYLGIYDTLAERYDLYKLNRSSIIDSFEIGTREPLNQDFLGLSEPYPNPASDVVNFDLPANSKGEIIIYNQNGQQIESYPAAGLRKLSVTVKDLPPGVYYYRFLHEDEFHSGKFVVQ